MGELQHEAFQFTFNGFLKVAFQGSRITSDAGLLLVRALDERLGLATLIAEHLSDSRQGLNTQFSLADLLRQSVYSRLAGYEALHDAVRVSADPTSRLARRAQWRPRCTSRVAVTALVARGVDCRLLDSAKRVAEEPRHERLRQDGETATAGPGSSLGHRPPECRRERPRRPRRDADWVWR